MPKSKPVSNILFPGRADYTGPTKGWFGLLHHSVLFETSHNVNERIDYIKRNKPKREISIRLHNLIYLGGCDAAGRLAPLIADYNSKLAALLADYDSKCAALLADYNSKCAPLDADYSSKRAPLDAEVLCYIKKHIPDCAWYEENKKLHFRRSMKGRGR